VADDGHGGSVPGKWKDALPVIPDKVAEHIDAGRDVPVEAMVSEQAMEKFEDHVRSQAGPVHAEDLIPVSRDDPRIQGPSFGNGETLPSVPKMRRVIPAPFRRPRIAIDHHGKSWQVKLAATVQPGDILTEVGKVALVRQMTRYVLRSEILGTAADCAGDTHVAVGVDVVLTGISGCEKICGPNDQVRVFTAAPGATGAGS
jgi:hypothetical protein